MPDARDITPEELLPCPFCGGRAFIGPYGEQKDFAPKVARSLECNTCDVLMFHVDTSKEAADANLTERWNLRQVATRLEAILEAVTVTDEVVRAACAAYRQSMWDHSGAPVRVRDMRAALEASLEAILLAVQKAGEGDAARLRELEAGEMGVPREVQSLLDELGPAPIFDSSKPTPIEGEVLISKSRLRAALTAALAVKGGG